MGTRLDDWLHGQSWWDIAIKEAKKNATPSPANPRRERTRRSSAERETPRKANASPSSTPGRRCNGLKDASSASPASAPRTPRTPRTPVTGLHQRKSTTPGPSPCTTEAGGGGSSSRRRPGTTTTSPSKPPPATEAQHLKALYGRMEAHWLQLRPLLSAKEDHDAASIRAVFDAAGVGVTKHQVELLLDGRGSISLSSLEPKILRGELGSFDRTKQTLSQVFDTCKDAFTWFDADSDHAISTTEAKNALQKLRIPAHDVQAVLRSCNPPLPWNYHEFARCLKWGSNADGGSSSAGGGDFTPRGLAEAPSLRRWNVLDKKVQAWLDDSGCFAPDVDLASSLSCLRRRWQSVWSICDEGSLKSGRMVLNLEQLYGVLRKGGVKGDDRGGLSLPQVRACHKPLACPHVLIMNPGTRNSQQVGVRTSEFRCRLRV